MSRELNISITPLVLMDGPSCSGRGVWGGETGLGEDHGWDSENKECTPGIWNMK